jgi:succinate dehydrogenase / fumarate reductase cytochrome b subunit
MLLMSSTATSSKSSRNVCWPLLSSSIGRKWIVAVTGVLLILFVIGHLAGNLSIFLGQDAINAYGQFLHDLGEILWVVRIVLFVAVVLHITCTILLWHENLRANPRKYAVASNLETTIYARSMRLSGLVVLAFIAFHLAEFTWQWFTPEYKTWMDAQGRHDVYRMVIAGFSNPFVSGFYIIAIGLLAMHLSHGIASLFQTLGLTTAKLRPFFARVGLIVAWVIFAGYISIPLAVILGLLRAPQVAASSLFH